MISIMVFDMQYLRCDIHIIDNLHYCFNVNPPHISSCFLKRLQEDWLPWIQLRKLCCTPEKSFHAHTHTFNSHAWLKYHRHPPQVAPPPYKEIQPPLLCRYTLGQTHKRAIFMWITLNDLQSLRLLMNCQWTQGGQTRPADLIGMYPYVISDSHTPLANHNHAATKPEWVRCHQKWSPLSCLMCRRQNVPPGTGNHGLVVWA